MITPSLFVLFVSTAFANPSTDPQLFVNLAKKSVPSVVNISTVTTVKAPFRGGQDDFFRKFFEDFFRHRGGGREDEEGDELPPPSPKGGNGPKAFSLGTGFIIDSSGLILTNNHVVVGADEIKIAFTEDENEKPTDGEVVGRDPELDIALIKVKTTRTLSPLSLGDSDTLEVGEFVMAVGNPFGQGHTVTHGIISAKGRRAPEVALASYIQTDTPINPGNSGGPLINLKGEVIGINNAIDQRAQGIGFAIPINLVKNILPQLKASGKVQRGYIGVEVTELSPEIAEKMGAPKDLRAPLINNVMSGEPADKAGIKPYDIIKEVQSKPVHTASELIQAITTIKVGEKIPLKVLRNGKELTIEVTVAARPLPQQMAQAEKKPKKGKKPARTETGMELDELTPEIVKELGLSEKTKGIVVENVTYGSPADQAGMIRGDVILEVDRKPVKAVDDFYQIVKEKKSYLLRVVRANPQGGEVFLVVVLDLKK